MAGVHFLADVHLTDGQPDSWRDFFAYLDGPARACRAVYLLGDVFNAWIGDDDDRELAKLTRTKLRELCESGVRVCYVWGNHDFMIGSRFGRETGVEMLGDSAPVEIDGVKTLLLHGDTLCTADHKYLKGRRMYTSGWFLFCARRLPRWVRRRQARRMLAADDGADTAADPRFAVDEKLVDSLLAEHGAEVLIHGHTHVHGEFAAGQGVRWVLPAWPGGGGPGGWLEMDAGSLRKGGGWSAAD